MRSPHTAALLFASLVVACGGADPTDLLTPSDAATPTDGGGPPDVQVDSPTPPPVVCATDAGSCGDPNVPSGWTPVAFTSDTKKPCPSDFGTADDVMEDPTLGAGACSCSCTKTQDPDCQTGSSIWSGIGSTCSSGAASLSYSGGKCHPTNGTVDDYDKATTIPPSGGTCSVQSVANSGAVTSTPARLCPADAKCAAAACGGYAPSGFTACIVADGDVACPPSSTFSTKHLVTKQAALKCSDCGSACTFQGSCTNPKLSFYSDSSCLQLVTSIPADGTCDATGHANALVGGLTYTATASFTGCTATGSSTGSLNLDTPRTVCCRP
ncbi:MAG TPA: hypothetical protein VLM85_08895 [Polyangiaceae bacterium]|nr:hypothetical protein [Polyangiaceae bacterium]